MWAAVSLLIVGVAIMSVDSGRSQLNKWKSPLLSVGLIGGLFVNMCVLGNHYQFLRSHLYLKTRETWVSLSFRLILRPYRFSLQHQLLYKFRCWSNFLWLVERLVTLHCLFYLQRFQLVQGIGHAWQWKSTKKKDETFLVVLNSYSQSKDILRLV